MDVSIVGNITIGNVTLGKLILGNATQGNVTNLKDIIMLNHAGRFELAIIAITGAIVFFALSYLFYGFCKEKKELGKIVPVAAALSLAALVVLTLAYMAGHADTQRTTAILGGGIGGAIISYILTCVFKKLRCRNRLDKTKELKDKL